MNLLVYVGLKIETITMHTTLSKTFSQYQKRYKGLGLMIWEGKGVVINKTLQTK
jgi:hypothetical protein